MTKKAMLSDKYHSPLRRKLRLVKGSAGLYAMLIPAVIYFAIFCYWPMNGILIAFKDYQAPLGVLGSPWVGFRHFATFFNSIYFERILTNTIQISLYSLICGFPLPIILALMMNEVRSRKLKKAVQTIAYAPYFISLVVMIGMVALFLNPDYGLVNNVIKAFGGDSISFMSEGSMFKSIYVWSGIWQGTGWGTVIYLAVLSNVDNEQIEAAVLDGASRWQQLRYIIFPTLVPTIVIMFILSFGGLMNVSAEKILLMQNELNRASSDVIGTYVYRMGLEKFQYGLATAVGLFNSVINFVSLIIVNAVAKRVGEVSLW